MDFHFFSKPKVTEFELVTLISDGEKWEIERKDAHLPKGLRIGAIATMPESVFIAAQAFGSVIPSRTGDFGIKSISAIHVPLVPGMKVYRAYLTVCGDNDNCSFIQATVQIREETSDKVEKLIELAYFTTVFTDYPSSEEDWNNYLGEEGIGSINFTDNDGHEYHRVTGRGEHCRCLTAEEKGIITPAGDKGWASELSFHVYERELQDGSPEFCTIEVFEVKSSNVMNEESGGVRFMVGIPLPLDIVLIQTNSIRS
jgi:hypothetical protein